MAGSCFLSVYLILNDYFMYLYKTLCLIFGVGFFIFTIFINWKFKMWSEFTNWELVTVPKIIWIIGLVFILIAVIGLCGMIRESLRILMLFTILQTIVVIGELVISGVIYSHIDQMDTYTSNLSLESMKQYNISDPKDTITERWDFVQNNLECCGTSEPGDWKNITGNFVLPWSCCGPEQNKNCTLESLNKSRNVGCLCKLKENIHEKSDLIIWFVMGSFIVQVLALVLAYGRVASLSSLHSKYRY